MGTFWDRWELILIPRRHPFRAVKSELRNYLESVQLLFGIDFRGLSELEKFPKGAKIFLFQLGTFWDKQELIPIPRRYPFRTVKSELRIYPEFPGWSYQ